MDKSVKPCDCVVSEMLRLVKVFLWIESTAEISVLSRYSTSGLLIESQEDTVSSIETDIPSDLLGETSMVLGTSTVIVVTTVGAATAEASFLSVKQVTLLGKITSVDLTFCEEGNLFPIAEEVVHAGKGASFLVLATLVEHDGTFQYKLN